MNIKVLIVSLVSLVAAANMIIMNDDHEAKAQSNPGYGKLFDLYMGQTESFMQDGCIFTFEKKEVECKVCSYCCIICKPYACCTAYLKECRPTICAHF